MRKLFTGIAVAGLVAVAAAGGWFAHDAYLNYLDGPFPDVAAPTVNAPSVDTSPLGMDTRPVEDLPKCAELDPRYLAWLDSQRIMRPRCQ